MKQQLCDYSIACSKIPMMCDNTNVISVVKNPIEHFRIKHIDVGHHFIRDHGQKCDIVLVVVISKNQLVS